MQSSSQIITNKPTSSIFTGWMPFLSPNQQCQSTEGKMLKCFCCKQMDAKLDYVVHKVNYMAQ